MNLSINSLQTRMFDSITRSRSSQSRARGRSTVTRFLKRKLFMIYGAAFHQLTSSQPRGGCSDDDIRIVPHSCSRARAVVTGCFRSVASKLLINLSGTARPITMDFTNLGDIVALVLMVASIVFAVIVVRH